jgi:predicted GNAT superfamily acetyltransferase
MQIRPLATIEECRAIAALEREIWGMSDGDDIVAPPVLIVSVRRGGILLGAFDEAGELQGFVYSMVGLKGGAVTQWSHMLGVRRGVRESGLAGRLKLAQREAALQLGIELIEWTFDPLLAPNAHLNFAKLGVVVEEYEENIYGDSDSMLHRGSPTDRFVAEWHLRRPHVERRIASWGQPVVRDSSVGSAVLVNPARETATGLAPGPAELGADSPRLLVEIPTRFADMQAGHPDLALAWRMHTRGIFQAYFRAGYRAVDFFMSREAGRGQYLLARKPPAEER